MKTDYKNINSFEVAAVCAIIVGFLLVGIVLFSGLTPNKQAAVASSFDIFDLHRQSMEAFETIKFVYDIPEEFYKQFYIAFTELATLPEGTLEMPVETAAELYRNVASAFTNLSDQVANGYSKQNSKARGNVAQAYEGQVMGAMIDLSYRVSEINEDLFVSKEQAPQQESIKIQPTYRREINFYYQYEVPKFNFKEINVGSIR